MPSINPRDSRPLIVFDLDGTLAHTAPDICASVNGTLAPYGAHKLSVEEVTGMIGNGLNVLLSRAMEATNIQLDPKETSSLVAQMIERYAEAPTQHSTLYPGVEETLRTLKRNGFELGVCTNKTESIAKSILDDFNLTPCFSAIIGSLPERPKKPDPLPLELVIDACGGDVANTMLIGDSAADADTAKALNIPCLIVTFGYTKIPPGQLGGTQTIDHFHQIPDLAAQLLTFPE